jgi:hypothetical protein
MKNLSVILILVASLLLAIFFFWQYKSTQSDLALANQRMTDRDTQIYKQAKEIEALKAGASGKAMAVEADTIKLETPPSAQFADELGSLSEAEISRLEKKGLENPELDLKNDLLKKTTLIPAQGTVGGTMAFRDIRILNDHYALAYFDDGHKGGNMLLKYSVANGNITWKVLDTYGL